MHGSIERIEWRKLDQQGVEQLVRWAAAEGWNPGPDDAMVFYQTDPDGFYGYYVDNKMIAGGAIVSYGGDFGFMGLFIVDKPYRNMGIGRKLWIKRRDMLLSRLHAGASIGMDGVVAMQPFYEKGGFNIAFRDMRYVLTGQRFPMDSHISQIVSDDIRQIHMLDTQCFGFQRPGFLYHWLKLPGISTYKYLEGDKLLGFALVRKALTGYKVCPLFAENAQVAAALYEACLNGADGEPLYIDVPQNNPMAVKLVSDFGASPVFECARMIYGKFPAFAQEKVFGLTSFELG